MQHGRATSAGALPSVQWLSRKMANDMKTLGELLTPEERAAIRAPIEKARTLPRRAFVDPEFHAFEVEHALKESWLAVTFTTEVPDAGDVTPLTVLGIPVLLVRGRDGIARAFHNVRLPL